MSLREFGTSISSYFQYRKRFERIPGFAEFYRRENEKLAVTSVRVLCTLGVVLYTSVGIMDYILYPDKFPLFISMRLIFAATTTASLLWTFTAWGRRNSLLLIFISALFGELLISGMISQLSGWTSLYFVGNLLITNAMTMFIPWRPRVGLLYCALSLLGYIFIVRLNHPFSLEMVIPVTFISINGLLAYFSSRGSEASRMAQWASLQEIEKQHDELKQLNETKERFFANISHELRTPLTLIIGPLGALAKAGGGWVSQELVASMVANAQRLLRQVNSLLDLNKIDSEEMKLQLEVGNLKEVVLDLYRACAPGAYERGIKLEFEVPPQIPNSKFDFEKVETILANLISNALKFTPGGGRILLSCELQSDGFARLGVKDTGPGIPVEEHEKVFERFHQVETSAKEMSKGTGLGLSVAKELAELHGGRIWFESGLDQGTQFFVEIPFLPTEEPAAPMHDAELRNTLLSDVVRGQNLDFIENDIAEENKRRMKDRRQDRAVVLYVDDSPDLRRYVDSILASYYTVLLAADGEQGFAEAMAYAPDLILSDVMMPKMDGFEFCQKVRGETKLKTTSFILLTANSSLDAKIEGLQGGADDYLGKPFSERELLLRIKNQISLREKNQVLKKQIEGAKRLQVMLLPPLTQTLQGVKIEAIYKASEELSGDFFDTVPIGKWIYIYLAEVGGRGIPAAQVTYLVREIFKHALVEEIGLSALFDLIRARYVERYPEFELNLQLMRINSVTRDVEYLRANAANPVLVNYQCETQEVDVPLVNAISPVISPSKYQTGQIARFKLVSNSKLYCYSEGAYKFRSDSGEEFGHDHLMKSFAGTHLLEWPEGLVGALKAENRGESFPEDLTILRISFNENTWNLKTEAPKMGAV